MVKSSKPSRATSKPADELEVFNSHMDRAKWAIMKPIGEAVRRRAAKFGVRLGTRWSGLDSQIYTALMYEVKSTYRYYRISKRAFGEYTNLDRLMRIVGLRPDQLRHFNRAIQRLRAGGLLREVHGHDKKGRLVRYLEVVALDPYFHLIDRGKINKHYKPPAYGGTLWFAEVYDCPHLRMDLFEGHSIPIAQTEDSLEPWTHAKRVEQAKETLLDIWAPWLDPNAPSPNLSDEKFWGEDRTAPQAPLVTKLRRRGVVGVAKRFDPSDDEEPVDKAPLKWEDDYQITVAWQEFKEQAYENGDNEAAVISRAEFIRLREAGNCERLDRVVPAPFPRE